MQKTFALLRITATSNTIEVANKFPFPVNMTIGKFRNISIVIHNGTTKILHVDTDLRRFSFVWLTPGWDHRDLGYALWLYLESTQTPHSYAEPSPSKLTDCILFALNNLPVPDTVFVNRRNVEKQLSLIEDVCGFPLIIKDTKGSRGRNMAFVASREDLLEKVKELPEDKKFLFQRYLPHDYVWGIMVANGSVVAGSQTHPPTDGFRSNLCLGGKEVFVPVSDTADNIKTLAIKASDSLRLGWSRVDIIVDKRTGLPYLLEVNRNPGVTPNSDEVLGAYTFIASQVLPLLQADEP